MNPIVLLLTTILFTLFVYLAIQQSHNNIIMNQGDLVDELIREGVARSPAVQQVLKAVDRKYYVSAQYATTEEAYYDAPLPIGMGQTISGKR